MLHFQYLIFFSLSNSPGILLELFRLVKILFTEMKLTVTLPLIKVSGTSNW